MISCIQVKSHASNLHTCKGSSHDMGTNNFTYIANFVAKSAYKYVVCNTYIPRVYILLSVVALSMYFIRRENNFMAKQEAEFSNAKA